MASVLYTSARAVSLEKTLLGGDRLKRMIDGNTEDALKILSEVGFGAGESNSSEIDAVSAYETAKLCAFVKETAPDEKTAKFFLYPFDFKNAEAIVKAKYLKTDPELFSCGWLDEKILNEKNGPTAFYCYTDSIAVGVYTALRMHNFAIPKDYSVMSFGNDPGNELLQPALTTTQFHFNEMAEAMLDNLVKPAAKKRSVIASSFYFRDSVRSLQKSKY